MDSSRVALFLFVALGASLFICSSKLLSSEIDRQNATATEDRFSKIFPMPFKKGAEMLFGGGLGVFDGPDDSPPPDFKPRGWPYSFLESLDPLFWYDLQWDKPEEILLYPKHWYVDEDLALAWISIMAKQKMERITEDEANGVNTHCSCQGACNCKTFAPMETTHGLLLQVFFRHPITGKIFPLQIHRRHQNNKNYLLKKINDMVKVDLNICQLLVDGKPITTNYRLEQGSMVELLFRMAGGAKGSKTALNPCNHQRELRLSAQGTSENSNDDEDRRSLVDDPIRYDAPTCSEDSDSEVEKENVVTKKNPQLGRAARNKKTKVSVTNSKRKQKALSTTSIDECMKAKCCKANCIKKILKREDVVKSRKQYRELSEEGQRNFLLNFYVNNQHYYNGKRQYKFLVNCKTVCRTAWMKAYSISPTTFHRLQRDFEHEGRLSPEGARTGRLMTKLSTLKAEAWLEEYIEDSADRIPNEDRFCLPTCMTKTEIYHNYVEDMRDARVKEISMPTFCRMWRKKFRNVIIPKENKFTKCGVCVALKLCLQGTTDKQKRLTFTRKRKIHNEQQMAERRAYYGKCLKAEVSPRKYLSLIIDGMDQSKTNLPHANCLSKDETYHFLRTHITGAISHGDGRIFTFIDLMRWPHDSNLTLNVLLKIFMELAEEGQLPPYLFLQMDNCYRECKNRFILGFCALLVEKGIFKEVQLSFLMVGHTHEDVDQFFSRISKRLRRQDSMTLPELMYNIQKAHTPEAEVHIINYMFDIKKWIEPCLNTLKNHVYPHAYKFTKRNGEVIMKYKQWANDESWLPDGPGLKILAKQPEGTPPLIRPDTKKMLDVDALADCVKKCPRLKGNQKEWWADFIDNERRYREKWNGASEEYLSSVKKGRWYFDKLRRHKSISELHEDDVDQQERERNLENLLNKANQCPKVIVGEKRKQASATKAPRQNKKRKTQQ